MNFLKRRFIFSITLFLLASNMAYAPVQFTWPIPDSKMVPEKKAPERTSTYEFSARFKPGDSLYAKNATLLNSNEDFDRFFYMRHTLDLNLKYLYGYVSPDGKVDKNPAAQMRFSMRNKANWGNPFAISTTKTESKLTDFVGQEHNHSIGRNIFWIREAWLEFCINDVSGMDLNGKRQTFKLGAFPFQLGRGISLGNAFAVGADYLGFYSDSLVDQYAFGLKLSGDIIKDKLSYDIYGALLNNKSGSTGETGAKVFGQQYGRQFCPERGFGILNTVVAGRLNISAVNIKDKASLTFEPYAMVNTDKEQMVNFMGDANSKLGTIGLACEFEGERFEFGFDGAVNMGNQYIKGWDRNIIEVQNKNGQLSFVNSHVYVGVDPCSDDAPSDLSAYKAPNAGISQQTVYTIDQDEVITSEVVNRVAKQTKDIIANAERDCRMNGKLIGTVSGLTETIGLPNPVSPAQKNQLYNAPNRFRDPYKNKYKGFMFVTDGAVCLLNKDLKLAATAGYASGDADPNLDKVDGDYRGFIPLQEAYSGYRVNSAFYMGGTSKLKRPIDTPTSDEEPAEFAKNAAGFTDLAFVGAGIKWEPKELKKKLNINPNILAYWQTWPDRKFDYITGTILPDPSRSFLGTEMNIFLEKYFVKNMKIYIITSLFVPGAHFDDVKGKPMDPAQQKRLASFDRTGIIDECLPNVGTDTAFAFNIGFEYFF